MPASMCQRTTRSKQNPIIIPYDEVMTRDAVVLFSHVHVDNLKPAAHRQYLACPKFITLCRRGPVSHASLGLVNQEVSVTCNLT